MKELICLTAAAFDVGSFHEYAESFKNLDSWLSGALLKYLDALYQVPAPVGGL